MINLIILIAFILNIIFFLNNNKIANILNIYDEPDNIRKTHKNNVPLTGGVAIIFNIFLLSIFFLLEGAYLKKINIFSNYFDFLIFFISTILFFLVGFFDDKYKISATKKFSIMILILLLTILISDSLLIIELRVSFLESFSYLTHYLAVIWTLLCFLLFINALNMFDGINYQVGIYSIFICIFFIINNYFTIFFIIILIPLLFFLFMNHQNKAFLGDSGSYLLGFIFSYFFIKFYNNYKIIDADQIVLFMIIPGLDLMRLFIYRIYKGNFPFTADRNHLHYIMLLKNNLIFTNLKIFLLTAIPAIIGFYIGFTYLLVSIQILIYLYFISKK